jgi:hypothetical protein
MRKASGAWPWVLGVFAIGTVFGWLEVGRYPSNPYAWIEAIVMSIGVVLAVWKMARSGT